MRGWGRHSSAAIVCLVFTDFICVIKLYAALSRVSVEYCKLRYGDYLPTIATVIVLFAGIYWTMVPLGPTPIHSQPGTNNTTSAPAALNSSGGGSTKSNSSVVCIIALFRKIMTYNPKFRANVKSDIILQTWQHYLLPFGLINAQWLILRPLRFKMTLLSPSDMWKIFCDRFHSLFYHAPPQIVYQN